MIKLIGAVFQVITLLTTEFFKVKDRREKERYINDIKLFKEAVANRDIDAIKSLRSILHNKT